MRSTQLTIYRPRHKYEATLALLTTVSDCLTVALQSLVHQPVQEGAAVVAEGGAGVAVSPELVEPRLRPAAVLTCDSREACENV